MAKNCGWDKDFIAENFTIDQIKLYFEYLGKMEETEIKKMAVAFRAAQMKDEDFQNFLNDGKGIDSIEEMKEAGLPIEEQ